MIEYDNQKLDVNKIYKNQYFTIELENNYIDYQIYLYKVRIYLCIIKLSKVIDFIVEVDK